MTSNPSNAQKLAAPMRHVTAKFGWVPVVILIAACAQPIETGPDPIDLSAIDNADVSRIATNPISIENAVRFGVLSAKDVLASDIRFEQSRNEIVIARAAFYPEVFFNVGPNATDSDIVATGRTGVRYTLYDFGERAALVGSARAQVEKARYDVLSEIDSAALESAEQYIDLAYQTAVVDAANEYDDSIDDLSDAVRARVEIGVGSGVDLNEVETGQLSAATAIEDARAERANAKSALESTLGISLQSVTPMTRLRQSIRLDPQTASSLPDLSGFPTFAALQQAVTASEFKLRATQASLFPGIGVEAAVGVDIDPRDGAAGTGLSVGPVLSEAISLGGGRRERVENAELEYLSQVESLRDEERRLRLEFAQARTDLEASRSRVSRRANILDLNIQSRDIMREEYEVGSRSLRDLVDAEERIYDARVDLLKAYRDELKDRVALLKAVNQLSAVLYEAPE